MMDEFREMLAGLDVATHADFVGLKQDLDEQRERLNLLESELAELPAKYASAGDLNRVTSSQAEYELRSRQLTQQVADLANIIADSQRTVTSIEAKLNELSSLKGQVSALTRELTVMSGNLNTFMDNQRERLDTQQATITEVKQTTVALGKKVEFVEVTQSDAERRYYESYNPLRDSVLGSPTQEGLKATISRVSGDVTALRSEISQKTAQDAVIANYVKLQQEKEATRVSFSQRIWLQIFTKTGFALLMVSIFLVIIFIQSIDLERSFSWIRQLAGLFGVKVG